jgi:ketosteroid isomerase-like protein
MVTSTIDELTAIQQQLLAGWVAGDPSTHERILDDNWSVIDPTGNVITKADVLSTAFSATREIEFAEIDQINVRDHDDFAIVTGRTRVRGKLAGQDVNMTLRFTDVFTNRSGTWRCLASQGTIVTQLQAQ